jgi:undecaprenyl-diphosphatase
MNNYLFNLLNGLAVNYPALNPLFAFMGREFVYIAGIILVYFLLAHKDKKIGARELAVMIMVAGVAWFIADILKGVFDTVRPFVDDPNVMQLFPKDADGAFPSGHATFFSALAMTMWFYNRKVALWLIASALVIGVGRVISGVHWPGDILGGYVLGILVSVVMHFVIQKFLNKRSASGKVFGCEQDNL